MSDSPSWLTDASNAGGSPRATSTTGRSFEVDPPAAASSGGTNLSSGLNNTSSTDVVEAKDLPGIILTMRLANMGVAAATITVSLFVLIRTPALSSGVLAIYAICGGLLICCLETQLKFLRVMIAVNFGFLFNSVWRFLFYIIMGSIVWSFNGIFTGAVAIALAVVAFFNTYILCRYPAYRKIREQIAEEEDKRIEARISKEVKRQAVNQVLSGNNR